MRGEKMRALVVAVVAAAVVLLAWPARAQTSVRDEEQVRVDAAAEAQLARLAPDAVPLLQQAVAAAKGNDLAGSRALYDQLRHQVPEFTTASRRYAALGVQLGQVDSSIELLRQLAGTERTPANDATLALMLASGPPPLSAAEKNESRTHIQAAMNAAPQNRLVWLDACQIALALGDTSLLDQCSRRLDVLAPEDRETWMARTILLGSKGHRSEAQQALEGAAARGLDPAVVKAIGRDLDNMEPWPLRWLRRLGIAVGLWFAGFALLLFVGSLLNRRALAAAAEPVREAHPRPWELRLRHLYRRVLWVACLAYYLSMPLLAAVLLVLAAGIVLAVLATGFITIKLFLLVGFLLVTTLVGMVKAIFARDRENEGDAVLDLDVHTGLRDVLLEVASVVDTRPVDRVILLPGTEISVFDRGRVGAQLRGGGERCLRLGVAALDGLTLRSFKAVLAHEYGHFKNEDTTGFGFTLAVRRSMRMMIVQLVARRANSIFNPAWWFVVGFARAFLRISQGASRLQEVLADRVAAFAYGSQAFEDGLRHVIVCSVRFDARLKETISEVTRTQAPLPNLYARETGDEGGRSPVNVEQRITAALERAATETDSHPAPRDRFTWVRVLGAPGRGAIAGEDGPTWSLFRDREEMEAVMMAIVRANLVGRGMMTRSATSAAPSPQAVRRK